MLAAEDFNHNSQLKILEDLEEEEASPGEDLASLNQEVVDLLQVKLNKVVLAGSQPLEVWAVVLSLLYKANPWVSQLLRPPLQLEVVS